MGSGPARRAISILAALTLLSGIGGQATLSAQEPATVLACVNPRSGVLRIARARGCQFGWISLNLEVGEGGETPAAGPRVVDADGNDVGAFLGQNVLRQVGDDWLVIPIAANGFQLVGGVTFFFPSSDCAGDAYLEIASQHALAQQAYPQGSLLHFAGDTFGEATMVSSRFMNASGVLGACENFPEGFTELFGRDTPVDANTFGLDLTRPFRISDGQE